MNLVLQLDAIFRASLAQNKSCEVLIWDPTKPAISFEGSGNIEYFEKPFSEDLIPEALKMLLK